MDKAKVKRSLTTIEDAARKVMTTIEEMGEEGNKIKNQIIDINLAAEEIRSGLDKRTAIGNTNNKRRR